MNLELSTFKEKLLNTGLFTKKPSGRYTMKTCPYCGDSKNHLYVKIDVGSDDPVSYYCFKCNENGYMKQDFLDRAGIDLIAPSFKGLKKVKMDTVSCKAPNINVDKEDDVSIVSDYINGRVGVYPTLMELQMFGYVGNPYKYIREYLGSENSWMLNGRVWFKMTNGNIIGRWTGNDDETDERWLKYRTNRCKTVGLYNIHKAIDIYEEINVIIAEGVMDVIGLYYHYKQFDNCIYIGVMGKNYLQGIKYVLNKGFFGSSVNIRIFVDPGVELKDNYVDKYMSQMFKSISIYENLSGYDYGHTADKFDIHKEIKFKKGLE